MFVQRKPTTQRKPVSAVKPTMQLTKPQYIFNQFLWAALCLANLVAPNKDQINMEGDIILLAKLFRGEFGHIFVEKALLQILAALYGTTINVISVAYEIKHFNFRNCKSKPCEKKCGGCIACEQVICDSKMNVPYCWSTFEEQYNFMSREANICNGWLFPHIPCDGIAPDGYLFCSSCVKNKNSLVKLTDQHTLEAIGFVPLNGQNIPRPRTLRTLAVLPPCKPQD
jgi:hypothetical protein